MAKKGWFTHLEWNTRAPRFSPEERAALQVALFYCWNTANHEQGRISGDIIAKMLEGEKP
jgi:alkylhydroperoxidase family enzyme